MFCLTVLYYSKSTRHQYYQEYDVYILLILQNHDDKFVNIISCFCFPYEYSFIHIEKLFFFHFMLNTEQALLLAFFSLFVNKLNSIVGLTDGYR